MTMLDVLLHMRPTGDLHRPVHFLPEILLPPCVFPLSSTGISKAGGWLLESILTMLLMFTVFAATDSNRARISTHLPVGILPSFHSVCLSLSFFLSFFLSFCLSFLPFFLLSFYRHVSTHLRGHTRSALLAPPNISHLLQRGTSSSAEEIDDSRDDPAMEMFWTTLVMSRLRAFRNLSAGLL